MLRRKPNHKRRLHLERLELRRLLAADSIGVTPQDTGEFLLGTVAVTPVFFESNGEIDPETQNWSEQEIQATLDKVLASVDWWSDTLDTLDTVHTLDFVIDDTYARTPFETGYEPIDRTTYDFDNYVGEFLTARGYGDAESIEDGVRKFNQAQRIEHQTDWSFTIFVVDSSDDPDGLFPSGSQFSGAFAYPGGLFYITPSSRPTSTFSHEMGHIFWAEDEYAGGSSWNDRRGYYDTQNLNGHDDNPDKSSIEISIMRGGVPKEDAFEQHFSPASTLALVGWQDSDGDGIFDVADVPLELNATGYFNSDNSIYHFAGTASAVALFNQNSSGTQSDITLNRVSALQYQLDDGPWVVAATPDRQVANFDLTINLDSSFDTIRWRAVDSSTGVTSAILEGTSTIPAMSAASISGLAFLDDDSDAARDLGEPTLAATTVTIRDADGSPLFAGSVQADDFADGEIAGQQSGVTIRSDGIVFDTKIGSFVASESDLQVFAAFNLQQERWTDRWSEKVAFVSEFDSAVGEVQVEAIGLGDIGYVRLEAYDASGNLVSRTTSEALSKQQVVTVGVVDPRGRIASIRAFGHAGTEIGLSGISFGNSDSATTDSSGAWSFHNLPDGQYQIELAAERLIHQFDQESFLIDVSSGASQFVASAANQVDSPRYNAALPADANEDGKVTLLDALLIINDIREFDTRTLAQSEGVGIDIDVSNDGLVSVFDALLVINYVAQNPDPPPSGLSVADRGGGQMLNSAGDTTPDESGVPSDADTPEQEGLLASDFQKKSRSPVSQDPPRSSGLGDSPGQGEESAGTLSAEIAEPFDKLTIQQFSQ